MNMKLTSKWREDLPLLFNSLLFMSGVSLVIAGACALHAIQEYRSLFDDRFYAAAVSVVVIGVIMLFFVYFGFLAAIKQHTSMLKVYIVFVAVMFFLQFSMGILIISHKDSSKKYSISMLKRAVKTVDINKDSINFLTWVQQRYECCGLVELSSYQNRTSSIPVLCCSHVTDVYKIHMPKPALINGSVQCGSEEFFKKGCADEFDDLVDRLFDTISCSSFAFCI